MTAHYFDSDFTRQTDLIFCKPLDCAHTGENIAKVLLEGLNEARIPKQKRHLLVRDAAATMSCAAKHTKVPSIDCFIHKIQLCVHDAMADFENVVKEAKKVPSLFNRSSKFRKSFKEVAEQMNLKFKVLIQVSFVILTCF